MHNSMTPGKNVRTKYSPNNLIYFAIKITALSLFSTHCSEECVSLSLAATQSFSVSFYSLTWQ